MAARNAKLDVDQADNLFGVPVCMRGHDLLIAAEVGMSRAAFIPLSPEDAAISRLSSSPNIRVVRLGEVFDGEPVAIKYLWAGPRE